jgi:hypothetical protein
MKRFWHKWLTVVAIATMVSTASAQSGSRVAPEIGSYQSILSRAGYGDVNPGAGLAQPTQYGCASGNCGGAGAMVTQPTYTQPSAGFGYQGGGSVNDYSAPMQQQFAPAQTYQSTPMPTTSAPVNMTGPMVGSSDPVVSSVEMPYAGSVSGGSCGGAGYAGAGYSAPAYSSPVYSAPAYSAPSYSTPAIYSPGSAIGGVGAIAGRAIRGGGSNLVASVSALAFIRDYEDRRLIARNPAGEYLFTNEADHDTIGGVDFVLANRKSNGNGWEARYFGLFPDTADATLTGAAVSAVGLRGFDRLDYSGATLDTFFANGTSQTVTRDTDINSLEFNLLRNGGRFCTRRGRQGNFELLGGFRYFQFDEEFTYSTADGTTPIDYRLNADNTLLGLQVGSRGEICVSKRIRLAGGIRTGIFNNNVNTRQRISDPTGTVYATVPTAGDVNFDYSDTQNDVAFLSEIDFGLIFQLSCRARLRVGYRALGIAGVALATDQIPYEFDNPLATQRANTNGDLLLHGGYVGTEFCF